MGGMVSNPCQRHSGEAFPTASLTVRSCFRSSVPLFHRSTVSASVHPLPCFRHRVRSGCYRDRFPAVFRLFRLSVNCARIEWTQ